MKIASKVRLATGIGLAVIGIIVAMIWWTYSEVEIANNQRRVTNEIARGLTELRMVTFDYVLYHNERSRMQRDAVSDRIDQLILNARFDESTQVKLLASLRQKRASGRRLFNGLTAANEANSPDDISSDNASRRFESQQLSQLLTLQQDSYNDANRLNSLAIDHIIDAQRLMMIAILAGLAMVASLMIGASLFLYRGVLAPIAGLVQATRRIAAGNWIVDLGINRDDEIGELAQEFNRMTAAIANMNALLRKRADELARSNTELEQFAYIASHDLQEPLRMVVGHVQLLEKRLEGKLDADTRKFMGFAVDGAKRMQNLIEDILAFSRVSSQAQRLEPVDSAAALKEALDRLATRTAETGAKVDAMPLPVVMADRAQLVQVFQNLIANAIKFCKDRAPNVRVESVREVKRWRFSVTDNGIGIAPEYRGQLFVIFKRLHTRGEYPGTGIGLAICKRIVERHGGEIGIETAPGGGSVFWFTLPEEKNT